MKRIILFLVVIISNLLCISAQKITNKDDLKKFYMNYLTLSQNASDDAKLNNLLEVFCTKELYTAWNRDVNEIGLYDPFTNGYFDDIDLMKRTLIVRKEKEYFVVSFNYLTWDDKTKTESVLIYINSEGKISHTVRPSDNYWTPTK